MHLIASHLRQRAKTCRVDSTSKQRARRRHKSLARRLRYRRSGASLPRLKVDRLALGAKFNSLIKGSKIIRANLTACTFCGCNKFLHAATLCEHLINSRSDGLVFFGREFLASGKFYRRCISAVWEFLCPSLFNFRQIWLVNARAKNNLGIYAVTSSKAFVIRANTIIGLAVIIRQVLHFRKHAVAHFRTD